MLWNRCSRADVPEILSRHADLLTVGPTYCRADFLSARWVRRLFIKGQQATFMLRRSQQIQACANVRFLAVRARSRTHNGEKALNP